jgi:two-component system phosphate regulon response regulator PhoB
MSFHRILIVEDEADWRRWYKRFLPRIRKTAPVEFAMAKNAEEALDMLRRNIQIDLVMLDWILPGVDGLAVLKAIRSHPRTRDIPVVMVSAKAHHDEVAEALDAGADDFMRKPVHATELLARLRSLARRKERPRCDGARIICGSVELDPASGVVMVGGETKRLLPKERHLLEVLMRSQDQVLASDYLWQAVWDYDSEIWAHVLSNSIWRLRRALGKSFASQLVFLKDQGYCLRSRP